MYIKIQSRGIAGGDNTGSCNAYVYYLEHETIWKKMNGKRKEILPFYDQDRGIVSPDTVIQLIDSNKKGLHLDDAKFYSIIINPSEKEIKALGKTREERLDSMHKMVTLMMDRYATGFDKADIKGHQDLLFCYTLHEYREDENGNLVPGLHAQIIISRKDKTGRYKISPMTNHRQKSTGAIKSGFDRDIFYRDCETIFDTTFKYRRRKTESYDYLNTMKHGTNEDKSAIIWASLQEEGIRETVSESLSRRITRLEQEAEVRRFEEDKKKRNKFWNLYYSSYKPQLDTLCRSCNDAFALYSVTKDQYGIVSDELDKRYQTLRKKYIELGRTRRDMTQKETADDLIATFFICAATGNVLAFLIIAFLFILVQTERNLEEDSARREIREQIASIKRDIETLSDAKETLYLQKNTNLTMANKRKEDKLAFKVKLNSLKEEMEKSVIREEPMEIEKKARPSLAGTPKLSHKPNKGVKM